MSNTRWCTVPRVSWLLILVVGFAGNTRAGEDDASESAVNAALRRVGVRTGLCVVLGLPEGAGPGFVSDLAASSDLLVYFQSADADEVDAVRDAARTSGRLGTTVFADAGSARFVQLADNLAGAVLVGPAARAEVPEVEILRVLHPEGKGILGDRLITKPYPPDTDTWSHPYHGSDNNPQSTDRRATAPYLTQFLAEPKFVPMPEISVAAGGRVYRAFGHIAHKANQNAMLNTLICVNAFNGMILWKRPLKEGFMIHRNTMIAAPDGLYMGDDESCKLIDRDTGEVRREIRVPRGLSDGPVWKWMALHEGTLYALVGGKEIAISTQPSTNPGLGHWPWGMWAGHDYADPKTSFGFGRTFVAIDPSTGDVLWHHREDEYIDSRGVCMKDGRIYFYAPEKFLACLDTAERKVRWRAADEDLLAAIGPNQRAQHYVTGYATTSYIKCNDDKIFFAGPQRSRLVVASAKDGYLLWQKEHGNYQLVLREDAVYAAGPQDTGAKFDYSSGNVLASLPTRRACTRATGSVDSIFYRTTGGTVRFDTGSGEAKHIAPMRPPCQDGVMIAHGNLYWGPWMCGCQLSLYGHICLTSASDFLKRSELADPRLETQARSAGSLAPLEVRAGDWPEYLGDIHRGATTRTPIPERMQQAWTYSPPGGGMPTAPVMAGGLVFVGDRNGTLRAVEAASGKPRWSVTTGGAIYFPPSVAGGRIHVGSADGSVHSFEAATGRRLWRCRVGPAVRRIPVYGRLISTWPVAGGVVTRDGVVYAAAGIAHYDGTHVVALDAASGAVRWHNGSSGTLSEEVDSGVSLQGSLSIAGGELRFRGGGIYHTARYDLETGRCLNQPQVGVTSRFQTAFYPYFPSYSQFLSLERTFPDGRTLRYEASYEGSRHSSLDLLAAATDDRPAARERARTDRRQPDRREPQRNALWRRQGQVYNGFILGSDALVAAGQVMRADGAEAFVAGMDLSDGSDRWRIVLTARVVKGGVALDADGILAVALEDGRIVGIRGDGAGG